MGIIKLLLQEYFDKESLAYKVRRVSKELKSLAKQYSNEKPWISGIGAFDIDPKHLSFCICVKTDREKQLLSENEQLQIAMREILISNNYPEEAVDYVQFSVESQETVDRESNGSWFHHFR